MTGEELDRSVLQELQGLPKTLADDVATHLVMAGRLLDVDPEQAYGYTKVAFRLASRVAAVREAVAFAAYATERYAEALAEFRARRRMTGGADLWPLMADCERGVGRPERALEMAGAPEVKELDQAGRVEMRMVAAGARRDRGQFEAAVVTLQGPELASTAKKPWAARLRYAYADALLALGDREDEAREWFARALEADQEGATDAADRLAALDGLHFVDAFEPDGEDSDGDRADEGTAEVPATNVADVGAADAGTAETPASGVDAPDKNVLEDAESKEEAAVPAAGETVEESDRTDTAQRRDSTAATHSADQEVDSMATTADTNDTNASTSPSGSQQPQLTQESQQAAGDSEMPGSGRPAFVAAVPQDQTEEPPVGTSVPAGFLQSPFLEPERSTREETSEASGGETVPPPAESEQAAEGDAETAEGDASASAEPSSTGRAETATDGDT